MKYRKQVPETMISPEILKNSFKEAIAAVEDVSTYKQEALPKMKETIKMFNDMAIDGQKVVNKIETAETASIESKTSEDRKYLE